MKLSVFTLGLGVVLAGCSSGNNAPDATVGDASTDLGSNADGAVAVSPAPAPVAALPVASTERIVGMDGPVDVVVDHYGWPHIYATTLRDAAYVEGLLMARDRMAQMDVLRRLASGTLAAAFGALSSGLVDQDLASRVLGLHRAAQAIYDAMPPGRPRTALDAFSAGVNKYLTDIRSGRAQPPAGTSLVLSGDTPAWTSVDSLTLGRYQSYALSYDADGDIARTQLLTAAHSTFDTADATAHPDLAARHGFGLDVLNFTPPASTTVLQNFYQSGSMGLMSSGGMGNANAALYANAQPTLRLFRDIAAPMFGPGGGSNNWVVLGSATANGHALLENDPHLALTEPAVWWGVHLTVPTGPDALDVAGVTFAGIPGVILGYNTHVAWGATTAYYDVTDVYQETIVPGTNGAPDGVMFNGTVVPLQTIVEPVDTGTGTTIMARIEVVPHHGPILPTISGGMIQPRTGATALSVRWTGQQPSSEFAVFVGYMYANSVADAIAAAQQFGVGAQNFVFADVSGAVAYDSHAQIPIRAPGARTWNPTTNPMGTLPCFVLPGTGEAEWTGNLPEAQIPHANGSAALPFIATANNDQTGEVANGNPLTLPVYLGCVWDPGWRAQRITQLLSTLGHPATLADMQSIQNDHHEMSAARFAPFIQAALVRLAAERTTSGASPDLTAFATASAARAAAITDAGARLMAWTYDTPSGMEAGTTPANLSDSVATSIFQAWLVRLLSDAFDDEFNLVSPATDLGNRMTLALYLLEHPTSAHTYDMASGQSILWDDIRTTTVHETRDLIIVRALDEALQDLETRSMGASASAWLWGNYHTLTLSSIIPGPGSALSIPPPGDSMYPHGYPRPGAIGTIDVADPGTTGTDWTYAQGPSQRFSVEMDPAGPRGFNALPGGQSIDATSPHHADEWNLWRVNLVHAIPFRPAEVAASSEARLQFHP